LYSLSALYKTNVKKLDIALGLGIAFLSLFSLFSKGLYLMSKINTIAVLKSSYPKITYFGGNIILISY